MDFKAIWAQLAQNFTLTSLIIRAAYIICIAIAFEALAWWAGRKLEKWTTPFIKADAERDSQWRIRRRTLVRQTPKIFSRSILYALALILVFDLFGVPVLPLSLSVGAVLLLFGAAFLPVLRDFSQGYTLLAEDALAPGDAVEINGLQGIVEKFTLRGIILRDKDGRAHLLSNRDVSTVSVYKRKTQEAVKESL